MKKALLPPLLAFLLMGCKPDSLDIELYTSDIEAAATSDEVIEVPVTASFSMMGDDDEGMLPKASETAEKYLSPESELVQSKGNFGEKLVVETEIPLGSEDAVNRFLEENRRVAAIIVEDQTVTIESTNDLEPLNDELGNINMMLDLDFPAKETTFRFVSDSKEEFGIRATAVFVSGKPRVHFAESLERRDSVEVVFSGKDGSIYQEISPYAEFQWPE